MPLLRQFFNLMPSRRAWAAQDKLPTEFLIDQYFNVPGVGLVVAGTLLSGAVHVNHELLMGPNNQGKFNKVTIKSIHHMRSPVPALLPGQTGAFVVRSRTKEHVRQFGIRKGMVLLDAAASPAATRVFSCDVLVLHSQTTMRVNYQPILYARNVRQCVRICAMDKEVLRTGTPPPLPRRSLNCNRAESLCLLPSQACARASRSSSCTAPSFCSRGRRCSSPRARPRRSAPSSSSSAPPPRRSRRRRARRRTDTAARGRAPEQAKSGRAGRRMRADNEEPRLTPSCGVRSLVCRMCALSRPSAYPHAT